MYTQKQQKQKKRETKQKNQKESHWIAIARKQNKKK